MTGWHWRSGFSGGTTSSSAPSRHGSARSPRSPQSPWPSSSPTAPERTLGTLAKGTVRHVAAVSRLPEYPQETTRDLEHVRLLAERIEVYLTGLRESRTAAEKEGDPDTVDLLTGAILEFEKHDWFLRASLAG